MKKSSRPKGGPLLPLSLRTTAKEETPDPIDRPAKLDKRREREVSLTGRVTRVLGDQELDLALDGGRVYRVRSENQPWVLWGEKWMPISLAPLGQLVTVVGRLAGKTLVAVRVIPKVLGRRQG
ncbi:MAG TPA: hypothetical protein VGN26_17475 [Armatimonadota bacterium]|jgi:hypothetical protein